MLDSCVVSPLAFVNDAALSIGVQISLWDPSLNSLGYIHRSDIAAPCGNSASKVLKSCCPVFRSSGTISYSQQCTRVPVSPHPHQHWFFPSLKESLLCAILMGVKWYLIVTLICISLVFSDIEYRPCVCRSFVYLPWRDIYLNPSSIFKWDFCCCYYWVVEVLYTFWILTPCYIYC